MSKHTAGTSLFFHPRDWWLWGAVLIGFIGFCLYVGGLIIDDRRLARTDPGAYRALANESAR